MTGNSTGMDSPPPKRRKRPPVARHEGELRLIEATIELAREQPFGELSAREIARRADLNHGYVHMWFGSKAGLIDAASQHQTLRLVELFAGSVLTPSIVLHPEVELVFQLLARLQTEPGGIELARARRRPMSAMIAAQLQRTSGLSADEAAMVTALSVAAAAGVATVGKVLEFDVESMVPAWLKIIAMFRADAAE